MTGSPLFSLEKTDGFERSFRKLAKSKAYGNSFSDKISDILKNLLDEVSPRDSRDEPLPGGASIPDGWTLHKLEIRMGKGASGQVRLIYLVNESDSIVRPLWLYSHEQFSKRPPDRELKNAIKNAIE
ncbi:MAG: type II toxin-antitoxin system RelE/ParE family toxin [Cyanobacteria bacterium P01_F01_bin.33]